MGEEPFQAASGCPGGERRLLVYSSSKKQIPGELGFSSSNQFSSFLGDALVGSQSDAGVKARNTHPDEGVQEPEKHRHQNYVRRDLAECGGSHL